MNNSCAPIISNTCIYRESERDKQILNLNQIQICFKKIKKRHFEKE